MVKKIDTNMSLGVKETMTYLNDGDKDRLPN